MAVDEGVVAAAVQSLRDEGYAVIPEALPVRGTPAHPTPADFSPRWTVS